MFHSLKFRRRWVTSVDNERKQFQPKGGLLNLSPFLPKKALTEVLSVILLKGIPLPDAKDKVRELSTIPNFVLSMRWLSIGKLLHLQVNRQRSALKSAIGVRLWHPLPDGKLHKVPGS